MKVTCQVVTTPTVDSPGSALILGLESKRYLFGNVSEGIQRALLQRKIRTARIGDFFLTGKTEWKSVGGLLGMMLTLADQETARKTDFENKRTETIARNETIQVYGKGTMGTVQENFEKKVLNVHGGENLLHTLGTTRAFVFRTSMRTNVQEIEADYKDEHLRCHPIKVFPEGYVPGEVDEKEDLEALVINRGGGGGPAGLGAGARKRSFDGELKKPLTKQQVLQSVVSDMFNSSWTMDTMVDAEIPGDDPADPNGAGNGSGVLPKQVRAPWPASHVQSLPRSRPSQASLSYYVTLHPQRGRFLPNIAKALGVKPGPEFRKLTNGESVTTAEGKIVKPEECMEPQKPGKHILVLDIPDVTYIQPLLSREELQEENLEATIFWLLGDGVSADTRVWTKIRKWGNATVRYIPTPLPPPPSSITNISTYQHVLSSPDLCPNTITIQGAAKAATRLALLHPDHFPIPRHNNTPAQLLPSDIPNLLLARPSQEISILPKFDVRQIQIPMTHPDGSFDFDAARKDIRPEYLRLAEEARETVIREEREEGLEELPGKDVEIITLGTGSAMPSKYRNGNILPPPP